MNNEPCATCKGEGHIQCWSICPRCGGAKIDTAKILRTQVDKATFTTAEGSFEFERIWESRP